MRHIHGLKASVRADGGLGTAELSELYDLAVVVDYFGCGVAVQDLMKYSNIEGADGEYCAPMENLDRWLYVSMILRNEDAFRMITQFCIKNGEPHGDEGFILHELAEKKSDPPVDSHNLELTPTQVIGTCTSSLHYVDVIVWLQADV